VDNTGGVHNAVRHLVRLGRRRIGHIMGPLNSAVGHDRRQGYVSALIERGLPVEESLMVASDFSEGGGYQAARHLLAAGVDAIVAVSDRTAYGALRALREAGCAVPDDVALVGFDDLEASTVAEPPLTTVRQPIRGTGNAAVETLLDVMENPGGPVRQVILPTQLIVRESCGASFPKS
jgi:DNA-binding LacI/PurR family transcriptional regulator